MSLPVFKCYWFFQVLLARNIVYAFLLFFPLIFVLGLLPQINTFVMYLLEQVDIHLLGGNATSSLLSAIYCVIRSLVAISIVIGFAYGGLTGELANLIFPFSINSVGSYV